MAVKRLIIDCSVIWYRCWHRMKSPNYQAESPIELEEYTKNLAGELYKYVNRFQAEDVVFGIDSKEWRSAYYNAYYADRVHFWKHREKADHWVMIVDDKHYIIWLDEHTEVWRDKKATADEKLVLDLTDADTWIFFEGGKTPQYILDTYPTTFKTVQEAPEWEYLQKRYPTYKGGRNGNWPYETTYSEFKAVSREFTINLADTLGARAVFAELAEFDDIAYNYILQDTECTTVLITTDQDLDQLQQYGEKTLKIWNPGSGANNPERWVEMGPRTSTYHLLNKLVGGDDSDKIAGVTLKIEKQKGTKKNPVFYHEDKTFGTVSWASDMTPKKGKQTEKFCYKLFENSGYDLGQAHAFLKEHEVDGTYTKNLSLMHLGAAPEVVAANCQKALAETTVYPATYAIDADYCLTTRQLKLIENEALIERANDIEAGVYSV